MKKGHYTSSTKPHLPAGKSPNRAKPAKTHGKGRKARRGY